MVLQGSVPDIRRFVRAHGPILTDHGLFYYDGSHKTRSYICDVNLIAEKWGRTYLKLRLLGKTQRQQVTTRLWLPSRPMGGRWTVLPFYRSIIPYLEYVEEALVTEFRDYVWIPYVEKGVLPYNPSDPQTEFHELEDEESIAVRGHTRRPHYRRHHITGEVILVRGSTVSPHARRRKKEAV